MTGGGKSTAAAMEGGADVVYGFDPLCGWCFGFIPAMRALVDARPDLRIDLRLGGLVTGARIGPYALMRTYIEGASARMTAITGQALGASFLQALLRRDDVTSSSVPPSAAILAVRDARPDLALDFAHAVQVAHFRDGHDLNDAATYQPLLDHLGIAMDLRLPAPTDLPPALAREFDATRALGIASFPALLVRRGKAWLTVPSTYEPKALLAEVEQRLPASI